MIVTSPCVECKLFSMELAITGRRRVARLCSLGGTDPQLDELGAGRLGVDEGQLQVTCEALRAGVEANK
jgi:hypothetical protein